MARGTFHLGILEESFLTKKYKKIGSQKDAKCLRKNA